MGLEEKGYSVILQDWDFVAGGNFVLQMDTAAKESKKTIAIQSNDYIASVYAQSEWAAAFADDPEGQDSKLIPIRIEKCSLTGLLKQINYIDLVGITDEIEIKIKNRIADRIEGKRIKPSSPPPFPLNIVKKLIETKTEFLRAMISNEIIGVREKGNVKCIYQLTDGYFTNIRVDYKKLLLNNECLNYLVNYCKIFII